MALVDLIKEDVVKVPLISNTKPEIIKELLQILVDAGKISNLDAANEAILIREAKGSTGLENGIAVPHAKCPEVKSLTMAIGISPHGVDFLAPPDQSGPHIEALVEIAKLTRSTTFCKMLINTKSAKEVVDLITEE